MSLIDDDTPIPAFRDVTLRDGLQVHPPVPTETKLVLFEALVRAGITELEIGSFVRADRVPAMADTADLLARTRHMAPDVVCWALVLNARGAELALEAQASNLQYVISISDTHSRRNAGRDTDEAFRQLETICTTLPPNVAVELTLATAFGCPFDGALDPQVLDRALTRAADLPIVGVSLADTIGVAVPDEVDDAIARARSLFEQRSVGVHLHDTRGLGIVNALAAIRSGADRIDGSVGGLGGCPFAPGASGNLPLEDLVHLLHESRRPTGIDLDGLVAAGRLACEVTGAPVESHIGRAGRRFAA